MNNICSGSFALNTVSSTAANISITTTNGTENSLSGNHYIDNDTTDDSKNNDRSPNLHDTNNDILYLKCSCFVDCGCCCY